MEKSKKVYFPGGENINFGDRYVFFSSLLKDDSGLYSNAFIALNTRGGNALSFNKSEQGEKITEVINFFDSVINYERKKELDFIMNMRNKKGISGSSCYQDLITSLEKADYISFIKELNICLQNVEKFKRNLENEANRLRKITEEINKRESKFRGRTAEINRKKRNRRERTMFKPNDKGILTQTFKETLEKTYSGKLAALIENIIKQIMADEGFKNKIIDYLNEERGKVIQGTENNTKIVFSTNTLTKYIIQKIDGYSSFDEAVDALLIVTEQTVDDIFNSNGLSENYSNTVNSSVTGGTSVTEKGEMKIKGIGLADRYMSLGKKQSNKDIDKILMNGEGEVFEELRAIGNFLEALKNEKDRDSIIGGKLYSTKNGKVSIDGELADNVKNIKKSLKQRLSKKAKSVLQEALSKRMVEVFSQEFYLDPSSIAEAVATIGQNIDFGAKNVQAAGPINRKNDVNATVIFYNNKVDKATQGIINEIYQEFNSEWMKAEKRLRDGRHEKSSTTSPQTSKDALMEATNEINKRITKELEEQGMEIEEIENTLKNLTNAVNLQTSVKDYQLLESELGFKGGTLGSTWTIAVSNLLKMMETGGLSPVDYDWLTFAIMNCSSASVGHSLKNPIQDYLSFAAAMMMFDSGADELHRVANNLTNSASTSPENLTMYLVNGVYIPSSYILTLISQRLKGLRTEMSSFSETGVKIYNKANPGWINRSLEGAERWNDVKKQTSDNIQIIFTFLGGFLDIIDSLNQAMGN